MSGGQDIHVADLDAHTGFLLAEDDAVKRHFSGLTVPTKRGTKDVPVYFRWPGSERRISYPMITIDQLTINPAYDRWQSYINEYDTPSYFETYDEFGQVVSTREGHYYPSVTYDPNENMPIQKPIEENVGESTGFHASNFHPYEILYQISTWTRSVQQDRYLAGKFFVDMVGPRSFFIGVDADHTWRRCELLEYVDGDTIETTEADKTTFRKIYTIKMEAEIPSSQLYELVKVGRVNVKLYDKLFEPEKVLVDEFTEPAP